MISFFSVRDSVRREPPGSESSQGRGDSRQVRDPISGKVAWVRHEKCSEAYAVAENNHHYKMEAF